MSNEKETMDFLKKILKHDDQIVGGTIPAEIYKSVRVMRDDINELEGKPSEQVPGVVSPDVPNPGHPFLGARESSPAPAPSPSEPASVPVGKNPKRLLIPVSIAIGVLIIGSLAAYFFLRPAPQEGANDLSSAPESTTETQDTRESIAELPPAPVAPFSIDDPNYLTLDPESDMATPAGIMAKLDGVKMGVKSMNPPWPVEFLLRDGNNNPIAFSRFSYLMKLGIPEDVLAAVNESFSIYFVPEGSDLRMSLVVDVRDARTFSETLKREEAVVPMWFRQFFYGPAGVEVPSSIEFRSGTYGALETRFAVIYPEKGYSFDYIILGDQWVMGTSKDSFRATVDAVVADGI